MKITLTMLQVETGEKLPISFTDDQTSLGVATVIKAFTDNGYILSGVTISDED